MTQAPPPPPPPAQQYPPTTQYAQPLKPHRGGAILALGIVGLTVCVICGIIAWVMGNTDLREIDAGRMDPAGRGNTSAGRICGMISVILGIVGFVITMIWILVFALAAASMS